MNVLISQTHVLILSKNVTIRLVLSPVLVKWDTELKPIKSVMVR